MATPTTRTVVDEKYEPAQDIAINAILADHNGYLDYEVARELAAKIINGLEDEGWLVIDIKSCAHQDVGTGRFCGAWTTPGADLCAEHTTI